MNYSKLCSAIVAFLMVATVLTVPIGSFSSAAEEAAPAEDEPVLVDGSYGFEITDSDLESASDAIVKLIMSLIDDKDPDGSGDGITGLPLLPETGTSEEVPNIFEDKEALIKFYQGIFSSVPGTIVEVKDAAIDSGTYLGGLATVTHVAATDTEAGHASFDVDLAVSADFSTSVSGVYAKKIGNSNEPFSASVALGISGAAAGTVDFTQVNPDEWTITGVTVEGAFAADVSVKTDLPFLNGFDLPAGLPTEDITIDIGDDDIVIPKETIKELLENLNVLKKLDIQFHPKFYLSANTLAYEMDDDGMEFDMSLTAFNNLEEQFLPVLKALGLPTVDDDGHYIFAEIPAFGTEIIDFDVPFSEDIQSWKLDMTTEELVDMIFTVLEDSADDADTPAVTDETKGLVLDVLKALLGDDGFVVSDDVAKSISSETGKILDRCKVDIASVKHTVTVLKPTDTGMEVVKEFEIGHGKPIPMDDPAVVELTKDVDGKKFVGWAIVDIEVEDEEGIQEFEYDYEGVLLTSRVYGSFAIAPIYADVITDASGIGIDGEFYFSAKGGIFDYAAHMSSNANVVINIDDVDDEDGIIAAFSWNLTMGSFGPKEENIGDIDTGLKVTAVPEDLKTANKDTDFSNSFVLDFSHSGVLPSNTSVTVTLNGNYAPGTMFQVWHVDGNTLRLVNNAVIVNEDNTVDIPLEHCSSYVLTEGSPVDDMLDVESSGNGGNNNIMLYVGIGVAVIVLAGVALILFKRNH